MTPARFASLIGICGTLAITQAGVAQQIRPLPGSWVAAEFAAPPHPHRPAPSPAPSPHARVNRALLGGVLGAVAGVLTCQIISNAINSLEGDGAGMTGCTTRGNVQFAAGGVVVGGLIGWATYHKPHD